MNDIRSQFPALNADVAYLDNASTTQICSASIEAMAAYLRSGRSNIGRGLYPLAEVSMVAYENSRKTVAEFIEADLRTTIFTKSVTEGLNAIAFGVQSILNPGDEILVSPFEHHANLLPWRRIARERGAILRTMPMSSDFMLDIEGTISMMNHRTKIIATTLVSNVLGTVVPVKALVDAAQRTLPLNKGESEGVDKLSFPFVIVDAAQAAPHIPISMKELGADAIVFGSHKCYGPSGIAAMALSNRLASIMEPMIVGGGMVDSISIDRETWREIPARFEGGSPNVEGAIGFAEAVKMCGGTESEGVASLRQSLVTSLRTIPGVTVFDPADAIAIVSFIVEGVHPHDVADLLGQRGICVRAGNHCAQPLIERIALEGGTIRVSLAAYSTEEEIQKFLSALLEVLELLK
ncbi:MAG: aminotransferase class V-fold PLP-dependent enzyme [Patescibacteria group bacterium]|jgi:cysteine desulfurase/selenocysteine lyase